MLRKASEIRLHTDEQVAEIVAAALEMAGADEIPDELRPHVFVTAAGLIAQKQVQFEQVQLAPGGFGNGLIGG